MKGKFMEQTKKIKPGYIALIVIVLIGIGVAASVVTKKSDDTSSNTSTAQSTDASSNAAATDSTATYKDGTYSETGRYVSPGGAESIEVTLTVANNIITAADVVGDADNGESKVHQDDFIAGYKKLVVGKEVNAVSLSRIAGASLTTKGFNTALEAIKADAKA